MPEERTKTIVVKLGGSTLGGQTATGAPDTTLNDLLQLAKAGYRVVVVHGGGNAINQLLKKQGLEPKFSNGLRVTDLTTLHAALMVMRGQINSELVAEINYAAQEEGPVAIGLSGLDGRLIEARRETTHGDIGLVGDIVKVNAAPLQKLLDAGMLPVVSPFGTAVDDPQARIYNINADSVAAHLAAALAADACIFLTDVPGVLDKNKETIPHLDPAAIEQLVTDGVISGGMIPKIGSALKALEGAGRVLIVDGRQPNALFQAVTNPEQSKGTIFTR